MRLSVRQSDPAYDPYAARYVPFLNGEKLDRCYTADEERAEAFVYESGENGLTIVEGNELKTMRMVGRVQLFHESQLLPVPFAPS